MLDCFHGVMNTKYVIFIPINIETIIKSWKKLALVSTPDGGITLIMVFPSTPSGMVEREEWMDRWCCGT